MIRYLILLCVAMTLAGCGAGIPQPSPKSIKFIYREEPNNTVIVSADPKTDWEVGSDSEAILLCINELLVKRGDLVVKKVVPVETRTLVLSRSHSGDTTNKKIVTKVVVYFDKKQYVEEPITPKVSEA